MATKKKAAPAKKAVKPAAKAVPAKKKPQPAAKKAAPKKVAKPAPKAAPAKKAAAKPVAKKATPAPKPVAKKVAAKPVAKTPEPKKAVKPAEKTTKTAVKNDVPAKPVAPVKPAAPAKAQAAASKSTVKPAPAATIKTIKKSPVPVETPKPEPKSTIPPPPFKKAPVVEARPTKVVMPDIKTKSVKKYEPDFTKSVLDTPAQQQTVPTMRYSDAELGEFKELINKKLDAAKKELSYLQGLITRKDEMGGDESENRYMTMEDGGVSMEREQLSQMASRQITFIDHLEKALMRIENKTYGICRVTGKLIDKARLRAVPHATLSIEAKQVMNK
ncbi:TraR/DksA family transcriptional regulator [Pinibacter soli]|uniref:TraR/DksA C4-type zinc finger protein n=1 Tax=Pinibacter soli TaxID=3044211 RepID=A0ABT6RA80_9BACT|nr:TraR/DksA C4-type zinc finger protein [Pinibacter soli]MDI3318794.1 TraR/DksA C4-type zinc finger protein [Pinibacter soli]